VTKLTMTYPGDPAVEVLLMSALELRARAGPGYIDVVTKVGEHTYIDLGERFMEVVCDTCNDEIPFAHPLYLQEESRAYCLKCAIEWILPHITRIEVVKEGA